MNIQDNDPNPNILEGALIGGPDKSGEVYDSKRDGIHNGIAVDYNAGLTGALIRFFDSE